MKINAIRYTLINIMWILYDLIFLVFALVYFPVYLVKRKFHRGFGRRLGILPPDLELNQPIWIHAVSVGEVMAARTLIQKLKMAYPQKRLFITTVTPTGNKIAQGIASESDYVSYLPLDLSCPVKRVVAKINPSLFILMETEIWPNLISYLHQKNIPIILVNGRISDRSFGGYLAIKFLLKPLLNKINLFCVQTKTDAERLRRLGVFPERIKITGNMKFDASDIKTTDYINKYKSLLALNPQEKLWVSGSTHPGEEEIILDVYKKLLGEFPQLRLLIAPRHPQRAKDIERMALSFGFSPILISQLPQTSSAVKPIFILDVIGRLMDFYSLADIVFVGGSIIKKGGHNILEPAVLSKPIIFGPYMFNFQDIASLFLENQASLLVHNPEELQVNIRDLLNNPAKASVLSQRAQNLVSQNQGATQRNLEYIISYIIKKESDNVN